MRNQDMFKAIGNSLMHAVDSDEVRKKSMPNNARNRRAGLSTAKRVWNSIQATQKSSNVVAAMDHLYSKSSKTLGGAKGSDRKAELDRINAELAEEREERLAKATTRKTSRRQGEELFLSAYGFGKEMVAVRDSSIAEIHPISPVNSQTEETHETKGRTVSSMTAAAAMQMLQSGTPLVTASGAEAGEDSDNVSKFIQMLRQSVDDQLNEPEEAHFLMRIMHPYDEFRVRWDSFVLVAMMHAVVCIPFEICFDYNAPMLHIFTLVSLAMDIFLICDCALNFRTGYFSSDTGQYVSDPARVALHYLTSWFVVDFTTSLPIDILELLFIGSAGTRFGRVPRLLRLLKTARILKILRLFKLLNVMSAWDQGDSNEHMLAIYKSAKFIMLIFLMAHICGCIWYGCAFVEIFPSDREYDGWILEYKEDEPDIEDGWDRFEAHVMRMYLISLYWSFTTLTTTGFGDVLPRRTVEFVWCIVVMFTGTCTFGYIIGNISSVIAHEDETHTLIREKIQSINAYMKFRNLPLEMKSKIQRHYEYVWKRTTIYDEAEILAELPSTLRSQVALYVNRDIICSVSFLNQMGSCEVALLVEKMKPILASPHEIIVEESHFGRDMFFCADGELEIVGGASAQLSTLIIGKGSFFAEHSLVLEIPKHPYCVKATTFSQLLSLHKEEFDFVGYFFPHIYDKMLMLCTYRYYEIMEFMSQVDSQTLAMSMNRCAGPTSRQNEDGDSDPDDRKPENTVFGFAIPSVSFDVLNTDNLVKPDDGLESEEELSPEDLAVWRLSNLVLARVQLWKMRAKLKLVFDEVSQKQNDLKENLIKLKSQVDFARSNTTVFRPGMGKPGKPHQKPTKPSCAGRAKKSSQASSGRDYHIPRNSQVYDGSSILTPTYRALEDETAEVHSKDVVEDLGQSTAQHPMTLNESAASAVFRCETESRQSSEATMEKEDISLLYAQNSRLEAQLAKVLGELSHLRESVEEVRKNQVVHGGCIPGSINTG